MNNFISIQYKNNGGTVSHRIAFISGLPLGGSTTFVLNISRELIRRKIPVLVISPERDHPFANDFAEAGIPVVLTDDRRLIYEDRIRFMTQSLASFRPTTLIGCLGAISYEMLRYAPEGVQRVGVIQTDHSIFYDAIVPYGGYLDAVAGVSSAVTEHLRTMGSLGEIPRHYLPYGIPMPATFRIRSPYQGALRILYLGRLVNPQKRVYLLPKILKQLCDSGIPFHWTIAGEGEERALLERSMITTSSEQQVSFLGEVTGSRVPDLLNDQDIMILPSEAEGLPLSLLEAMGHGVVPVVSDLRSGLGEVVDPSCGCLIPVEETESYAQAIIYLHSHREALAAKSLAAHERVRNDFSSEAMTDRWLSVLPQPSTASSWPESISVSPPLGAKRMKFSPLLRPLRRMVARFR